MTPAEPPLALLAELTHRCPLRCPYCSNPLDLARASAELDTATWRRVFNEAAELGVLQVHFSGGEPLVRSDLVELVAAATASGLYINLITSGIRLDANRLARLVEAGLEHVQLSVQDADPGCGDRFAGLAGAQQTKHQVAELVREAGLPLTVNAVVHRQNLEHLEGIIDLAVMFGADRLEVAHVQYYGWALANRAALLPSRQQLDTATATIDAARARLAGLLCPAAESLHGWLGSAFFERHPIGHSPAMPRSGDAPGVALSNCRRSEPLGHLVLLGGVHPV